MIIDPSSFLKQKALSGIICRESASCYNGLSTYSTTPIMVYKESDMNIISNYLIVFGVDELDLTNVEQIKDNLYITNAERTICELIKYDCEERSIFESLETYLLSQVFEGSELEALAKKYDVLDKLQKYINELDDYFSE